MSHDAPFTPCASRAIEAYRYLPAEDVLQIVFRDGRQVYDYPCDAALFDAFLRAPSAGRFVTQVLRPHAQRLGWSRAPWKWSG